MTVLQCCKTPSVPSGYFRVTCVTWNCAALSRGRVGCHWVVVVVVVLSSVDVGDPRCPVRWLTVKAVACRPPSGMPMPIDTGCSLQQTLEQTCSLDNMTQLKLMIAPRLIGPKRRSCWYSQWLKCPRTQIPVRHSRGPPFPGWVRHSHGPPNPNPNPNARTVGMADPGNGRPWEWWAGTRTQGIAVHVPPVYNAGCSPT